MLLICFHEWLLLYDKRLFNDIFGNSFLRKQNYVLGNWQLSFCELVSTKHTILLLLLLFSEIHGSILMWETNKFKRNLFIFKITHSFERQNYRDKGKKMETIRESKIIPSTVSLLTWLQQPCLTQATARILKLQHMGRGASIWTIFYNPGTPEMICFGSAAARIRSGVYLGCHQHWCQLNCMHHFLLSGRLDLLKHL